MFAKKKQEFTVLHCRAKLCVSPSRRALLCAIHNLYIQKQSGRDLCDVVPT
jgi:hypothetical protein